MKRLRDRLFRWYTEWVTPNAREAPMVQPNLPLERMTVALITTAGIRLADQPPFDGDRGDPTFRALPGDLDPAGLVVDHTHYDTGPARADVETVFPIRTLRALAAEGRIGGVAPVHFGFMGYIPDVAPLVEEAVPEVIRRLQAAAVDAVLLSPG